MQNNNFRILKWVAALRFYDPLLPFYIIYAHYCGLSYSQVFLTQTIFALAVIIFELPGGIFSDLFGRKRSILFGGAFLILGAILFLCFRNFIGFAIAEISLALAFALFSGSDAALLYETTQVMHTTDSYIAKEGKVQAYARYAEGLSGISGGLLSAIHVVLPTVVLLLRVIPLLFISRQLIEVNNRATQLQFTQQLKYKLLRHISLIKNYLFNRRRQDIRLILLCSGLISSMTIVSFWLIQVIMSQQHFSMLSIGMTWLIYFFVTGFFSSRVKSICDHLSSFGIFIILLSLLELLSLGLGLIHSHWAMPLVLLSAVVFGIKMPFIFNLLNQRLAGSTRASILSIDSLLTRLFFSIIAIIIGVMLDHTSVQAAYLLLTIPNLIAFLFVLRLHKNKRH